MSSTMAEKYCLRWDFQGIPSAVCLSIIHNEGSNARRGMVMLVTTATDKINLVIVEDESLYRDLLRVALSQHPNFHVVGAYGDGVAALEAMRHLDTDVAILDIDLRSALNGVQLGLLLRQRWPTLGIVLLSNHGDPQFLSSLPSEVLTGWILN
jgi:CheY-like chemotaxis protein